MYKALEENRDEVKNLIKIREDLIRIKKEISLMDISFAPYEMYHIVSILIPIEKKILDLSGYDTTNKDRDVVKTIEYIKYCLSLLNRE